VGWGHTNRRQRVGKGDAVNITGPILLAQYQRARRDWPFIESAEAAHGLPALLLYAVGSRESNLRDVMGDRSQHPGEPSPRFHGFGVWQRDSGAFANPNALRPGQVLRLPGSRPPAPKPVTYTVRPGDTLSAIAGRLHTTVAALVSRNGIDHPDHIAVGQVLRLP
jgi:hypothetical protein